MSLSITYHELARTDLYEIWVWYEARERGLGDRFISTLDAALDQVADWPNSGSPTIAEDGEVIERRVGTTGFPYVAHTGTSTTPLWSWPSITKAVTPTSAQTVRSRTPTQGRRTRQTQA